MKVLLNKDVKGVGIRGEIVDVSDGYARNFILRNNFGGFATDALIRQVAEHSELEQKQTEKASAFLKDALQRLGSVHLVIAVRADEKGHLYAGLKEKGIAATIQEKAGAFPAKFKIIDYRPIKTTGSHEILVGMGNVRQKIRIEVIRQN